MNTSSVGPRVGEAVWLVPRTATASRVCFEQPKAIVVAATDAYLVVDVDGVRHEVHRDNVRRSNPARDRRRPVRQTTTTPAPAAIADEQEVPLW